MNSVNYALQQLRYPLITIEQTKLFVGNGIRKLVARALPEGEQNIYYPRAFSLFKKHYFSHCHVCSHPYDGILDLLQALKQRNYKMAIVSNKADVAVNDIKRFYFSDYVSVAIGEREGIGRKPDPESVFNALDTLKSNKENALYIGDSEVDSQTAQNAGLDCVLVSWGFRTKYFLNTLPALAVIDKPMQLIAFLQDNFIVK